VIPNKREGDADEELWVRWRNWSEAVTTRESVVQTMSEREHYMPIYQRYAEDRAMSELASKYSRSRIEESMC
jgi:glutathione S-transferase